MLVGVDVGARDITAVLLDGDRICGAATQPAVPSLTGGVAGVLRQLTETEPRAGTAHAVTISTTRFEHAVAEAAGPTPTGCIRLCATDSESVPPLAGWPARQREVVEGRAFVCRGGHEFDGTSLAELDVPGLDRIAESLAAARIGTVAITSVFSSVNSKAELAAAALLRDRLPAIRICLSHEIGSIGLIERENATIVNAALLPLADEMAEALTSEVSSALPDAVVYLAQNDGTVMDLSFARRYPIFTFEAGRTSAMRGAALLSGHDECVAVEIGEATTDIAVLTGGYPGQARQDVDLAGITTNLRRPESLRIPLGSLSIVTDGKPPAIGPEAATQPQLRGGSELTVTDLAVAGGLLRPADRPHAGLPPSARGLGKGLVRRGLAAVATRTEQAVLASGQAGSLPVVLVGRGATVVPATVNAHRPEHAELARAAGTASTRIGGEVDRIVSGNEAARASAVDAAKSLAVQKAVMAGAAEDTIRITEATEFPLAYLPGDFVRLTVKAVGDLA